MTDQPIRRLWWSYVRLSVRGTIVLILVIAAGLGWSVRSARVQHDAVAAIEKAGGGVRYDFEWKNNWVDPTGKPWAPKWLMDRLGVDYFASVVVAEFSGCGSDAVMIHVRRLNRLEDLYLIGGSVTDEGLAHLRGLTKLKNLDIGWTNVTNAGLAHLEGLTQLTDPRLAATEVTDIGLAHLKRLPNLQSLDLDETNVDDASLAHIRELSSLQTLTLRSTHPTDSGVRALQQALPNLKINR